MLSIDARLAVANEFSLFYTVLNSIAIIHFAFEFNMAERIPQRKGLPVQKMEELTTK